MAKGKNRASQQHDDADLNPDSFDTSFADTDPAPHVPTHAIKELEHLEQTPPRHTVGEIGSRLLCMAYLDQDHPDHTIDLCTLCLQSAIGEKPCPHGTFPDDTRERPLLLWRDDLIVLVTALVRELINPSPAPPTGPSAGEDSGSSSSHAGHRRVLSLYNPSAESTPRSLSRFSSVSVSSVSSLTSSTTSTASAGRRSVIDLAAATAAAHGPELVDNLSDVSDPTPDHAPLREPANAGEGPSSGAAHGSAHFQGCMYLLDEIRDAVVAALDLALAAHAHPAPSPTPLDAQPIVTLAGPAAPPVALAGPVAPPVALAAPAAPAAPVVAPAAPVVAPAAPVVAPAAPVVALAGPAAPRVALAGPAVPAVALPAPAAPAVIPPYVAQIDPFSSSVRNWHVVTVGRTVGVFREWSDTQRSTSGVSGNVHASFKSYHQAVRRFRLAEQRGEVEERQ